MESRAITRAVEKNGNEGKTSRHFKSSITKEVAKMQVDTFRYNGINLAIYETSRGYTINNIDFYNNIKELKATYKTLAKKMSGKISY